jgi:hypothetical protein
MLVDVYGASHLLRLLSVLPVLMEKAPDTNNKDFRKEHGDFVDMVKRFLR